MQLIEDDYLKYVRSVRQNGTIYCNPDTIRYLEDFQYTLLGGNPSDKQNYTLYKFLTEFGQPSSYEYEGLDSGGHKLTHKLTIPTWISKPKVFDLDDYPLDDQGLNFSNRRKWDYLTTFDATSVDPDRYEKGSSANLVANTISRMMRADQCQSRFSGIWRQMAACVFSIDQLLGRLEHPVRDILKLLATTPTGFPFYEDSRGEFKFETSGVPSILPTLFYGLQHLCMGFACGKVSEVEIPLFFQHWLELSEFSLLDMMLKTKSKARNWVLEATVNAKYIKSLEWNRYFRPRRVWYKPIHKTPVATKMIEIAREERNVLPPLCASYVNRAIANSTDNDKIRSYFYACRFMSNGGWYYATAVDLSIDGAVDPDIVGTLLPALVPLLTDASGGVYLQTSTEGPLLDIERQNDRFVDHVADAFSKINLDQEWLEMLTTSSTGREMPTNLIGRLVGGQRKAGRARLIAQAATADQRRSLEALEIGVSEPSVAGQRVQNDRRKRIITMVNNEVQSLTVPAYKVASLMLTLHDDAALGKQTGSAFDMRELLIWTGKPNTGCQSADVAGMDKNMQVRTRNILTTTVMKVCAKASNELYGPFISQDMILYDSNSQPETRRVSAAWQNVAFYSRHVRSSVAYKSEMQGIGTIRDGPFQSGVFITTVNHTTAETASVRANQTQLMRRGVVNTVSSYSSLGDDFSGLYCGKLSDIEHQAESDVDGLRNLGFNVTSEFSEIYGVMLQQMVMGGTFMGFLDRITLATREKRTERLSLSQSSSELLALGYDAVHRSTDLNGLKLLLFGYEFICISRQTVEIHSRSVDEFKGLINRAGIKFKEYPTPEGTNRLLTLHYNIAWTFSDDGGKFPPFPIQRDDGSYTPDYSMFSPSGQNRRRLLFDITGLGKIHFKGSPFLNDEWLTKLGFGTAAVLFSLDRQEILKEVASKDLDPTIVDELGMNLEQIGNQAKANRSRNAYERLKEVYTLPKHLVYGLKTYIRIEEAILQATDRKDIDTKKITYSFVLKLKASIHGHFSMKSGMSVYHFPLQPRDHLHCYDIIDSNVPYAPSISGRICQDITLSDPLRFGTPGWGLIGAVGILNDQISKLTMMLKFAKGEFSRFSHDVPSFEAARKVYHRNRNMMSDFYTALGADDGFRIAMDKALKFYDKYGNILYDYSVNPRQLMFIPDDPSCVENIIVGVPLCAPHIRAFHYQCLYLHVLSHPQRVGDKKMEVRMLPETLNIPVGLVDKNP